MFGVSNYNKAIELYNADKYQEAIPKFIKAVTSGDLETGSLYDGCTKLGHCCIETNDYDSAIFYLKEALRWETENFIAYFYFGRVYYLKEEYDLSLQYFDKSIEKYEHHLSWYWKGKIFSELNKTKDAEDAFRTALRLVVSQEPNNAGFIQNELNTVRIKNIRQLQSKGDCNSAVSKCNDLLENGDLTNEQRFNLHHILGDCYSELKQNQKAISEYNVALQIDSQSPDAVDVLMGGLFGIYVSKLQYDEAIDVINKAIHLLETYIGIIETDSSVPPLSDEEKKVVPGMIEELKFFSRCHQLLKEKEYDELLELCTNKYNNKDIIQFPPMNNEFALSMKCFAMVAIGECLHKLKRYDELLTTITPHLDDGDDNGVYASYVGIAHSRKEHYETALQYLNRGVENGNDDDSDTWGYKGECHFFLGQYEKAIDAYQKSIEVRIPNDDDDFEIAYLEERIQTARQKLAQEKAKVVPSHITIQGNSAPINLGGILATDDAVINRAKVAEGSSAASRSAFCPSCGSPVEAGDLFCRKCGRKLT